MTPEGIWGEGYNKIILTLLKYRAQMNNYYKIDLEHIYKIKVSRRGSNQEKLINKPRKQLIQ